MKLLEPTPTVGRKLPLVAEEKVSDGFDAVQHHLDAGDLPVSTASETTE
jgi:hypothetical protein